MHGETVKLVIWLLASLCSDIQIPNCTIPNSESGEGFSSSNL